MLWEMVDQNQQQLGAYNKKSSLIIISYIQQHIYEFSLWEQHQQLQHPKPIDIPT